MNTPDATPARPVELPVIVPRKILSMVAMSAKRLHEADELALAQPCSIFDTVRKSMTERVIAAQDAACFNPRPNTDMIDPKHLKSNVLRRIVADAQWEAGTYNHLALIAKASSDFESSRNHEFDAEGHRLVARVASEELIRRGEALR